MSYQDELREKGYCVIENVLSPEEVAEARKYFFEWTESNPQIKKINRMASPHKIFKHLEVGQQRHAWFIRTRPAVQEPFKKIWKTDDIVVSYDGCCWMQKGFRARDNIWTHTDQAPTERGLKCIQGFVTLTDNVNRSIVVYEGSHKLHASYSEERNLTTKKNWLLIDHDYLEKIKDKRTVVSAKAGSLVLWDSRTFHQNQYGENCDEERIVQYVSFLPKSGLTQKMKKKRLQYFLERRTTSHWTYPITVNGLQPQHYGNYDLKIDYSSLVPPDLQDMTEEIWNILV
jgi:ectoine hydroxylase-related dioxygenase (phytanoyl-CoA dioxygenase family)